MPNSDPVAMEGMHKQISYEILSAKNVESRWKQSKKSGFSTLLGIICLNFLILIQFDIVWVLDK